MIDPARIQAVRDRELCAELSADPSVEKALGRFEEIVARAGFSGRRALLGKALRMTRGMAPQVADALAACREAIGYRAPVEIYLRRDPGDSASVACDDLSPVSIFLASWLLELLTPAELQWVLGHELGHVALGHHRLMVKVLAQLDLPLAVTLRLFNWSRWAEVSADRAGLICAGSVEVALTAQFKLLSGVSSAVVHPDLESLARQVDSLVSAPAHDSMGDRLSTHPLDPIRARALLLFARSRTCREALGQPTDGGLGDDEVERLVSRDLQQMEASVLEGDEPGAVLARRLLYCAGISVAGMSGEVDERERCALARLVGAEAVEQFARQERSRHGVWPRARKTLGPAGAVAKVRAELEGLFGEARAKLSPADRARLVQLLCIVARADREVATAELEEMARIATRLEVDPLIVGATLEASTAPLD